MATLRNDTVIRSADGQGTAAIVTASNIGSYGVATNSTYYVGTTQNIFNRASGAQTLTGVSIDGSSASCTGNSATATILQTARNINGTSFNGSAAITTANWGTARTLTIGSTGKSVDGSAAITWSLAEIGAAATNQTMFVGTTSVAINRASASQTLTGVSIDGTASNITAYTINQSVGTANTPSFAGVISSAVTGYAYLQVVDVNNFWITPGNVNWGLYFETAAGGLLGGTGDSNRLGFVGSGAARFYVDLNNGNGWFGGSLTANTDSRAPIFYDSNDTAYYVDPNSISRLSSLRVYSAFDTASSDVYANMRVINDTAFSDGMYIGFANAGSGLTRLFGGGATTGALIKYSDHTAESNSFRAPIFYDSDNTVYYLDAANSTTSLLVAGKVGIGTTSPAFKLDVTNSITSRSAFNSPRFSNAGTYVYGVTNSPTWFIGNGSSTNNNATAPDATTTAGTYTLSATSALLFDLYQTISGLTNGRVYTVGMWVKLGTATNFCLVVNNSAAWNTIGGKAFTSSDGLSTSKWTHISYTFTATATGAINLHLGYNLETGVTQQTAGTVFLWNLEMTEFSSTWIGNVEDEIRLPGSSIWTSRGNVGIGTTNTDPLSLSRERNLAIVTTGTNAALTIIGGAAGRIDFGVGATRTAGIYSDSSNYTEIFTSTALPLVFSTNSAEKMRIKSDGNVGIGTTSPLSTLSLSGAGPTILTLATTSYPSTYLTTLGVDTSARGFLIFGNNGENQVRAGRTSTGGYLDFYTNNTVDQTTLASNGNFVMRLAASGSVGIGTTTPSQKLDVSGSINASTYVYAGVFYDNDNTVYYTNPSGTSNLVGLTVANTITGSVSGNAATATTSLRSTIEDTRAAQRTPNDYDDYRASYEFTNAITGLGDWHSAFTLQGWHNGYAAWQIIGPASTSAHENFYLRSGVNTTWNAVRTILHSGNYSGYSAFSGSVTSTYGNFTSPGLIIGDAQYGFYVSGGNIYYKSASGGVHYWRNIANSANTMSLDNSGNILLSGYVNASSYVYSATYLQTGGNLIYPSGYGSTQRLEVGNSANNNWIDGLTIAPGGTVTAPDNMRSPIFYDSNNTTYYIDPASTSNLNIVTVNDVLTYGVIAAKSFSVSVNTSTYWTIVRPNGSSIATGYVYRITLCTTGTGTDTGEQYLLANVDSAGWVIKTVTKTGSGSNWPYVFLDSGVPKVKTDHPSLYTVTVLIEELNSGNTGGLPSVFGLAGLFTSDNGTPKYRAGWFSSDNTLLHSGNYSGYSAFTSSLTSTVDARAPIFYDSNDTTYYIDPASTSRVVALWVRGSSETTGNIYIGGTSAGNRLNINYDQIWTSTGHLYLQYSGAGNIDMNTGGGHAFSRTSLRAPIFYDFDNTAYYVDPASTSNLNNVVAGGTLYTNNISKNSAGSPILINSGLSASLGLRVYYDMNLYNTLVFTDSSWNSQGAISGSSGVLNISAANATSNFTKYAGYSEEGGSFRAPIFYDSNNTAYYIDGASGSKLKYLQIDGDWGSSPFGSGHESFTIRSTYASMVQRQTNGALAYWLHHIASDGAYHLYGGRGATDGSSWDWAYRAYPNQDGNYVEFNTSARAQIFYDRNDTTYYTDPASTSRLNTLNVVGAVSAARGVFSDSSGSGSAIIEAYNTVATNGTTAIFRQTTAGGNGNQDIGLLVDIQGAADTDRIANFRYYNGSTYTSRMAIMRGGNVGIGTTSPGYKLDITGDARIASAAGAGALYFGTTDPSNIYLKLDNSYDLSLAQNAASGNGLYLAGAGNVYLSIDSNNNETDRAFIVQKDAVKAGAELFRVQENGVVTASSDFRAPIFYDSNDTTYYLDPNSNSILFDVEARGGINLRRDLSTATGISFYTTSYYNWQVYMAPAAATGCGANGNLTAPNGLTNVSSWALRSRMENVGSYGWLWELGGSGGGGPTATSLMELDTGGILTLSGQVRAPIFYDRDNTAYYLDPNSTTSLRTVGSWRSDSSTWDGEFSGKIQYHSNHWYFQSGDLWIFRNSGGTNVATINQSGVISAAFSGSLTGNVTGNVTGSSGSCTGNAATASNATQFGSEANTNFMRGLAGGTQANLDTYTDNGFRSIAYTGYSRNLLSFNPGGSTGTVQHEYYYNIPSSGWRVRNKTDNTTWSAWGNVVMTDTNQGALTGTIITSTSNTTVSGLNIGGNSGTVGGLSVHSGRNNEGNKVVRTDGSGYIQAGWINTDSGDSGFATRLTRITCSTDNYLRYLGLTDFKVSIGESAKNNYSRRVDYSSDANYQVGSFGHNGYGANETFHGGSGFIDIWNGTNYPSGLSHIHGFNALHYTVNSLGTTGGAAYGWQMVAQYNSDSGPWWRRCSGGSFSSWLRLVSYNSNQSGDIYATRYYDNDNTVYYIDAASTSNLLGLTVVNTITGSITGNAGGSSASCTGNAASATTAAACSGNTAGTASSISGFNNPVTSATANTIVYRDGSGHITGNYILGGYFNSNAGNSENPTIGQIWTQSTADNYLRKSTPAHFRSQVTDGSYPSLTGANASGTWSINITGNAGGSSASCTGNAASVTDGVYLSTTQSISGVKTFSSAPVAINIAKAWVHYNKSTTTINASYNVSSVTSNGTGVFTVNFTNAMVDANYVVTGTATYGYDDQDIYGMALIVPRRSTAQQAGSCRLATEFLHAAQIYDCVAVRAVFFR